MYFKGRSSDIKYMVDMTIFTCYTAYVTMYDNMMAEGSMDSQKVEMLQQSMKKIIRHDLLKRIGLYN